MARFGTQVSWLFFLATCLQVTFLHPYVVLIPGERANVFSGVLCFVSLMLALIFQGIHLNRWKSPEVAISLLLAGLVLLSGLASSTPASSSARGFVLLSSGLGGFWCARLLLADESRRRAFLWLSFCSLWVVLVLAVSGIVWKGKIFHFVDVHWHPVAGRVLLLSFAPLFLTVSRSRFASALGWTTLGVGYGVLLLAGRYHGLESAVVVPPLCCLVAAVLMKWSRRQFLVLSALVAITFAAMGHHLSTHTINFAKDHISVAYRVENLPFSWRIAQEHPLLGAGLWAPRERYLEGYEVRYPHLTPERFAQWAMEYRTAENTFVTFLADLGVPFVLLYSFALFGLMWRLVSHTVRGAPEDARHCLSLLLPVIACFLHLQVYEGLFQPQISWFFHLLLGLAPTSSLSRHKHPSLWGDVLAKLFVLMVAGGVGSAGGVLLARAMQ
ncbi:O-antigen ligase family protein [Thermodesulfobacteriota bacterium]